MKPVSLLPLLLLALAGRAALQAPTPKIPPERPGPIAEPGPGSAGDQASEQVLVSARGRPEPLSRTPGGVGLITAEEIATRLPVSLPNLLDRIPGAGKATDSTWGSEINIRGVGRDSVGFLIDGCWVKQATNTNARFGMIDPADIERVELLKGPISSLYGSGAIGGMVNIVTRSAKFTDAERFGGGLATSLQSNPNGYRTYAYEEFTGPRWFLFASQSYRNIGVFEDGGGDEVRNSQFHDYQARIRVGVRLAEEHVLEGQIQFFEGKKIGMPGNGTSPMPATADLTFPRVERMLYQLVYTYTPEDSWLRSSSVNFFYHPVERRFRVTNLPLVMPTERISVSADYDNYGLRWINQVDAGEHILSGGLDLWQSESETGRRTDPRSGAPIRDIPVPASQYRSLGAFLEDSWSLAEGLTLSGGARLDQIQVENNSSATFAADKNIDVAWSGHLGATLDLTEELRLKAIGARGFRSAVQEERFAYITLGGGRIKYGNPALDPEKSLFGEVGLNWLGEPVQAGLSGFVNRLEDLISDRVVDPTTVIYDNVAEAVIYGFEAEATWDLAEEWQAYGNLAWAKGRDLNKKEDLRYIPPLNGLLGLDYRHAEGFWGLLEAAFATHQHNPPPGVDQGDDWVAVRLRLGYDFALWGADHRLFLGAENLLDKEYRDYLTTLRGYEFNEPGRSLLAGYQVRF